VAVTEQELIERVLQWLHQNSSGKTYIPVEITSETDLLAAGLLDSLGFVDLITFIERQEGCRVDLADADPTDFAVVRRLCRLALKASAIESQNATKFLS